MKIQHIYWFSYFNLDEPSVRYRAKYPLQMLRERHGVSYSIVYPGYSFRALWTFIVVWFSALLFRKKGSVIVFQKIYSSGIYASALKVLLFFRRAYTLYDSDDAEHTRRADATIRHFLRRCSDCSVGSRALMAYTAQFNRRVFLLTSPVIEHSQQKIGLAEQFTVGWIGYYGAHRESLMTLFFPALLQLPFPAKFKLLGAMNEREVQEIRAYFAPNPHISVEVPLGLDWYAEESIYEIIKTFDVGVSPLLDNEFNRCKSTFKLKQCLSCGVPVLASSVGENVEFIRSGENGYLCDSPAEYLEKMIALKNLSAADYSRMSYAARQTFPLFSVDAYCEIFLDYFTAR